jgi:hypothetical protein
MRVVELMFLGAKQPVVLWLGYVKNIACGVHV